MKIFDPHITGSLNVSASANIQGDLIVSGTIYGTAQISGEVQDAVSASHAASYLLTSSFESYTGSVAITGSNTFIGDQTISGSLLPQGTLTHDLGSDTQRWRDIYLAGNTINLGGTKITKNDDGDVEVKDSSNNLKKIVASEIEIGSGNSKKVLKVDNGKFKLMDGNDSKDEIAALSGSFTGSFVGDGSRLTNVPASAVQGLSLNKIADGEVTASIGNGKMTLNANFEPDLTDTRDLGSPTKQWRDLFLSSGSLYINGQQVLSTTGNELRVTTDEGESIKILETGSDTITLQTENGDITLTSSGNGNIELDAPIQIGAGNKILSSDGNSIQFGNGLIVTGSIVLSGTVDGVDIADLKSDVDAILAGSSADKNSFAEIVSLINSVDTTNDQAFASHYTASNNRLDSLETKSGSLEGSVSSLETFTGSINTTIKSKLDSENVVSGSEFVLNSTTPILQYVDVTVTQSGGVYYIDGVQQQIVSLAKGLIYRFDVSDSSLSGHPFRFSLPNDTQYTDGVTVNGTEGSSGAYVQIVVNQDTPQTLQYYCTNHNGMGNKVFVGGAGDTDSITEGSNNLYYTDSRVKTKLNTEGVVSGSEQITISDTTGYNTLDGRIDSLESFTGSLDLTYASDQDVSDLRDDLNSYTSSNDLTIGNVSNDLGNLTTDFNTYTSSNDTNINSIQTLNTTQNNRLNSIETKTGSLSNDITSHNIRLNSLETVSGSHDDRLDALELKSGSLENEDTSQNIRLDSLESTSGSHDSRLDSLELKSGSLENEDTSQNIRLGSLESFTASIDDTYATDSDVTTLRGDFNTYTSSNNDSTIIQDDRISSLENTSGSHNTRLTNLETFESKVDGGLEFTGSNVTIKGDLLVKGTETRVDSTTVEVSDNIISLNGSGAVNGGIEVRDTTSPGVLSGSLLWDSTNNHWIGGTKGSEERLLTTTDLTSLDNDISGLDGRLDSIEIKTGSLDSTNTSQNSRLTSLESFTGSIDNTYASDEDVSDLRGDFNTYTSSNDTLNNTQTNRLNALETTSGSHGSRIDSLESADSDQDDRLQSLESKTGSLDNDISGLDGRLDSVESFTASIDSTYATDSDVSTLRGDFNTYTSSNDSDISSIQTLNTTQNSRLNSLESKTGSLDGDISTLDGRIDSLEVESGSIRGTFNSYTSSNNTLNTTQNSRLTSLESATGSYLTEHPNITPAPSSNNSGRTYIQDVLLDSNGHVTGLTTGSETVVNTDEYVTGASWNNSTAVLSFTRNDGDTFNVTLLDTLSDVTVTGGTYDSGTQTLELTKNDGSTISVSGFAIDTDINYYTTGATFNNSNGVLTLGVKGTSNVTVDLDGRYLTGYTETDPIFSASPSAGITNTNISNWNASYSWGDHSVEGYVKNDEYTTGATFNSGNGIITFTRNDGDTFSVDIDGRFLTSYTETDTLDSVADRGNTTNQSLNIGEYISMSSAQPKIKLIETDTTDKNKEILVSGGGLYIRNLNDDGSVGSNLINVSNGGNLNVTGTISASGYNDSNWNTAYGWGDHSTEGYVKNDEYTTGASFNTTTGIITFTRNDGDTFTVDIDGKYAESVHNHDGAYVNVGGDTMTGTLSVPTVQFGSATLAKSGDNNHIHFNGTAIIPNTTTTTSNSAMGTSAYRWSTVYGGYGNFSNSITGNAFVKIGGTSSQFLKADGSVDSNTYLTQHPSVSAASSSNNGGRTYIQDILLDGNGHVTGLTTGTETVTDTNHYTTGATFNTGNGIITGTRNDGGTWTVDLDGRYLTSYTETDTLASVTSRGSSTSTAVTFSGGLTASGGINGLTLSNGISGTNFNITGVNQLEIADPGEGIVFKQGSSGDITLAIIDDSNDNILNLSGTGASFSINGATVATQSWVSSRNYLTQHPTIAGVSSNNSGRTYIQDILTDSNGHVTGITTATETVVNTDEYTTGATFNTGNGIITFTRNDGDTYTLDISDTLSEITVTGGTYNSGTQTLTLTKSDGNSIDVAGFAVDTDINYYLTGATFNTSDGVLTMNVKDSGSVTVDLDGRYSLTSHSHNVHDLTFHRTGINIDTAGNNNAWQYFHTLGTTDGTHSGAYTYVVSFGDRSQGIQFSHGFGASADGLWFRAGTDNPNSENGANTYTDWRQIASRNWVDTNFLQTTEKAADSNLLDGLDSSQFLRSDTSDTMNGNLTIGGSNKIIINKSSGTFIDTGAQTDAFGYNSNYGHYIRGNVGYLYGNATYHDGTTSRTLFHTGNFTDNSSNWNTAYGWGNHASVGYLTSHPTIPGASSNNSGRTYIQDVLTDSNGHVTGLTTATETVVNTDTNYYTTGATFNTGNGIITGTRNDGGTWTVDIDGRYLTSYTETSTLSDVVGRGNYFGNSQSGFVTNNTWGSEFRRIKRITFTSGGSNWDSDNHGIFSTDASGNYNDSMSINSYNDLTFRVDTNSNNNTSYVRFMQHSTGAGTEWFRSGFDGGQYINLFRQGGYVAFEGLNLAISNSNSSHGFNNYFRGDSTHLVIGTGGTLYLNYGQNSGSTRIYGNIYLNDTVVLNSSRVLQNVSGNISMFTNDSGYLTSHPTIAGVSSNNSGRTYIQDILTDSNGHVTGITTGTETVVNTDTNYYLNAISWNSSNGIITLGRQGLNSLTLDIDGRYAQYGHQTTTNSDFNNVRTSGIYTLDYGGQANANSPDGGAWHALWHARSGGTRQAQITIPYNNDNIYFRRAHNSTAETWYDWVKIWHEGNDGAGSGLDSDTLDGQQGSYYLDYNNFTNKPTIGNGTMTISAGGGMSGGGSFTANQTGSSSVIISHADTSSQASSNNSGRTYIQDVLLDGYGHVTGLTTATETVVNTDTVDYITSATFNTGNGIITGSGVGRASFSVDIDGRYLPYGGGTITGDLQVNGHIRGGGQQLVLNAGESHLYATGQTNEYIYLNAEQGLEINSETGNWSGGWAARKTAYLRGDQLTLDGESLTKTNIQNFKTAYGWGNHATQGYVKNDEYVTGASWNSSNAVLTFTRNDGDTFNVTLLNTLSDVTVTGGTYNSGNQTLTLTKSDGNTVAVSGFAVDTDVNWYTTSASFNTGNGIITGTHHGGTWTVDIDGRYLPLGGGTLTGTVSLGELRIGEHAVHAGYWGLWNSEASTSTTSQYMIISAGTDTYINGDNVYIRAGNNSNSNELKVTTSGTYIGGNKVATESWVTSNPTHPSISAASSSNNSGRTYIQDILLDGNGHVTGITTGTETVTNSNYYTTGATFNTGNGIITGTRNDGGTWTVDLDGRYLQSYTEVDTLASVTARGSITSTDLYINNAAPTLYLQDNNNRSAMIHVNSNNFYILNGSANNSQSWAQQANSRWLFQGDLNNNNIIFGGSGDFAGVVTATGGNSNNWNSAYTYSQVGHLPLAGGTMSGGINMNNNNLTNVNHIQIGDPGAGEGIEWSGGNGFKIYESPNNLTNASGNLQFVVGSTRILTLGSNGESEFTDKLTLTSSTSGSTIFDIQGTSGQLFSITDDLTGDLFSVSDASGVPILNVNANGSVTLDPLGSLYVGDNKVINGSGNIVFDGPVTTTNQGRGIYWTAYDKEGTTDASDTAHILHTTNSGGLSGSVIEIKSHNDSADGVNFIVNATDSGVRINGSAIATQTWVDTNTLNQTEGDARYAQLTASNSFSNSYNEFGNGTGSVSNDGSWNARVNIAGSSHARLDVKSVSDGIITSMFAHTGQNVGKIGTYSNHSLELMVNGSGVVTIDSSGNISTSGTLSASGYNNSNWDTAYGWGNHSGLYLPIGGGTITGDLVVGGGDLTISKDGNYSTISFPAQTNDAGFIRHYESNNTARMEFSVSDDSGTTDQFHFGYSGDLDRFIIYSNGSFLSRGSGTIAGSLGLQGDLDMSAGTTATLAGISGTDQTVENNYGAYLHLGAWAVGRTDATAVLVNTAYRADYATSLFDMNISRFTNDSGYALRKSTTFTNTSDVSFTHGIGHDNVIVQVYDANGDLFFPSRVNVQGGVVEVNFEVARSGRLVVVG